MDDYRLEPEFEKPYKAWMEDPSPPNTDAYLKAINPVLTAAMRTYGIPGSPTLMGRAKLMALDVSKRYNPSMAKLRTHLMSQLQGLRRFTAREAQIMSVPEQVALDITHLRDAENRLRDELGRDPSDTEVAGYTNLPMKRIGYIRKLRPTYAEGFLTRPSDEGEDTYSPAVVGKSDSVKHWHEFVYHDLSPVDKVIMEHTLGLRGKTVLPNQEIARRLNISPGAVSQRKAKIQDKLNLREEFGIV